MSGALAGVIGLAAGRARVRLAADLSFLVARLRFGRERGGVRVCHRAVGERAVCECVAV